MRRILRSEHGALSVEISLLLPVFVFIMWFGAEAAYSYRLENLLHRGTASLAEMLANQPLEDDEELPDELPAAMPEALQMLRRMVGAADDSETQVGIVVTYYDTFSTDSSEDPDPPVVWSQGIACADMGLEDLDDLTHQGGGSLTTEANVAQTELVRVESCLKGAERWSFKDWVFPKQFSSSFITLRKEW
jgi:hypothetical protein